mgnify:CR=1 FL=1
MGWAVCDGGARIGGAGVKRARKIAVTGASGFIGRHVLAELKRHPVDVVAVTRDAGSIADAGSSIQVVEMDIAQTGADRYERLGRPDDRAFGQVKVTQ